MNEKHHRRGPSQLHRLSECPGSDYLSHGLPPEPESEYAMYGDEEVIAKLDPDQADLIDRIQECQAGLDITGMERERRLSLQTAGGTEILFGTADGVALDLRNPKIGYVFEYKFGRREVPKADMNLQAAAYAAAWAQEKGLEAVHAYIFQPRVRREPSVFTFAEPAGIVRTIAEILNRCEAEARVFKAGDHCRWCPARRICPELRQESALVVSEERAITIDNAAHWFDLASRVRTVASEVLDELKHFVIKHNGTVDGLDVVEVPGNRVIDPEDGFMATHQVLDQEAYRECVVVKVGALEMAFANAAKEKGLVSTQKEGKALFESEVPWTRKPGILRLRRKK